MKEAGISNSKCLQGSGRYHEGVRQTLVRDGVVGIAMTKRMSDMPNSIQTHQNYLACKLKHIVKKYFSSKIKHMRKQANLHHQNPTVSWRKKWEVGWEGEKSIEHRPM